MQELEEYTEHPYNLYLDLPINICSVCFTVCWLSFTRTFLYTCSLTHTPHPHSHLTPTHSQTHTHTQALSFLGFCVVFCLKRTRSYQRVGGRSGREHWRHRCLVMVPQLCSLPCLQCIQQALKYSAVEMSEYTDRDQKRTKLNKIVGYSFLFLNNKTHKKQQQSIYMNHGNIFIIQKWFCNIYYLMRLGNNRERKAPHKHMGIRTLKSI